MDETVQMNTANNTINGRGDDTAPDHKSVEQIGIWQYGGETNYLDGNSITGVGVIDKNKCYKEYPTIIKNGGYNGFKKGTSTNTNTNSSTSTSQTTL